MRLANLRPLTPAGRHTAFGYYDRCPWSSDLRHHLALAMPQQDHLPRPDEVATVCLIDHHDGDRFSEIATTRAWNHQQGAMTMWLPREPGHLIFNDREGDRVFSRVVDLQGREIRRLPRPIYNLSPDGCWACSLDFARIQRRGYSYAVSNPAHAGAPLLPADDGLWLMDTRTGASRLLCSYARLAALHPEPHDLTGTFCWLNHPAFNCDGTRLFVLFRYFIAPDVSGKPRWKTYLFTVGSDGSHPRLRLPNAWWKCTHHQWGRFPDEILLDQNLRSRGGEFTVCNDTDEPLRFTLLAPGSIQNGHQMFSPDHRWLMSDTAPDGDHLQHLRVADVISGATTELLAMKHFPRTPANTDMRCDLHPRWRPDGGAISIDSVHDGHRRIWLAELAD